MTEREIYAMPVRRPPQQKKSFTKTALLATSVLSGAMLGLAVPNLVGGDTLAVLLKSTLLGLGGLTVSYVVNRLAVERGAPLTAVGYWGAGVASVASILVVGGGLFAATYAGLTYDDVEQLSIERHGAALSTFVSERSALAANARGNCAGAQRACGRPRGQAGLRAVGIVPVGERRWRQRPGGTRAHRAAGHRAGGGGPDRQWRECTGRSAGSNQLSMPDKRAALAGIDLEIKQAAAQLDQAMPVSLISSFGNGIAGGTTIPNQPGASQKISDLLAGHAETLRAEAAGISTAAGTAPEFPGSIGVSDTFAYLPHFLPVAAIAAVVELVWPICLWLYTFFTLSWTKDRDAPRPPRQRDPDDEEFRQMMAGISPGPERRDPNHQPTVRRARRSNGVAEH